MKILYLMKVVLAKINLVLIRIEQVQHYIKQNNFREIKILFKLLQEIKKKQYLNLMNRVRMKVKNFLEKI